MPVLGFEYELQVLYAMPASRDFFTLRCSPVRDERQRLLGCERSLFPEACLQTGRDAFGNEILYGSILSPHTGLLLCLRGEVQTKDSPVAEAGEASLAGWYRYPHGKCLPWRGAEEFLDRLSLEDCKGSFERCMAVMHGVHERLSYKKQVTTVETMASEAWEQRSGVCQDYVQVYITLLRLLGIPARYVAGFILGEGESHAWAEALCDGRWIGFDPTLDTPLSWQYIKLAQGRDCMDCPLNRGIFFGGAGQSQQVLIRVWEKE